MNPLLERIAEAEREGEHLRFKVWKAYFPQRRLTIGVSKMALVDTGIYERPERRITYYRGVKSLSLLDYYDGPTWRYVDHGVLDCRGVESVSLQGAKEGATISVQSDGLTRLQMGDGVAVSAASVEWRPDDAYYIPDIEQGVTLSRDTYIAAMETFLRCVEPTELTGESLLYTSKNNSYAESAMAHKSGMRCFR